MVYLGVGLIVIGIALLVVTQIVLKRILNSYRRDWEGRNEV